MIRWHLKALFETWFQQVSTYIQRCNLLNQPENSISYCLKNWKGHREKVSFSCSCNIRTADEMLICLNPFIKEEGVDRKNCIVTFLISTRNTGGHTVQPDLSPDRSGSSAVKFTLCRRLWNTKLSNTFFEKNWSKSHNKKLEKTVGKLGKLAGIWPEGSSTRSIQEWSTNTHMNNFVVNHESPEKLKSTSIKSSAFFKSHRVGQSVRMPLSLIQAVINGISTASWWITFTDFFFPVFFFSLLRDGNLVSAFMFLH